MFYFPTEWPSFYNFLPTNKKINLGDYFSAKFLDDPTYKKLKQKNKINTIFIKKKERNNQEKN